VMARPPGAAKVRRGMGRRRAMRASSGVSKKRIGRPRTSQERGVRGSNPRTGARLNWKPLSGERRRTRGNRPLLLHAEVMIAQEIEQFLVLVLDVEETRHLLVGAPCVAIRTLDEPSDHVSRQLSADEGPLDDVPEAEPFPDD